ncbi:MAG: hypothetical protein AAF965_06425 [Pseudomonadota bacterium]
MMRVCVLFVMVVTFVVALFSGQVRFPALGFNADTSRDVVQSKAVQTRVTDVPA